jgi:hypothetical protein
MERFLVKVEQTDILQYVLACDRTLRLLKVVKTKGNEFKEGICMDGPKGCEVEWEGATVPHKTATLFRHILSVIVMYK